jgi:hypothetical protein
MGVLDWNTNPGRENDTIMGLGVSVSSPSQVFLV